MTEKVSTCPVCGQTEFRIFLESEDYFLTRERFTIVSCIACGFRFTNPRPDPHCVQQYYHSDAYLSHDVRKKGIVPALYSVARTFTVRGKYRLIKRHSPGSSLLDVGCGTGEFLSYCHQKGFRCRGVEPYGKAREFAQHHHALNVVPDFLADIPSTDRYDCITLWHVLEHIHQLGETMTKLRTLLSSGGSLIIALPNSNSYDAGRYGKFWAAYDLPRHIYHFTRETFSAFASKHAFSIIQVVPQKLDAFYISLLSEKYSTGSPGYLRAFLTGFRSNMEGRKPFTGHSSEIYILK